MYAKGESVIVDALPNCDLCAKPMFGQSKVVVAYADCSVPHVGVWAYVCKRHFDSLGCKLGTGRGQVLLVKEAVNG